MNEEATDFWCVHCATPMPHGERTCPACGFQHDLCKNCGTVFWEEFTGPDLCPDCIDAALAAEADQIDDTPATAPNGEPTLTVITIKPSAPDTPPAHRP